MSTTKLDEYYYVLTRLGFSIDSCLLTFRNAPLSINDVEYVAIRVLEPSDFHLAGDVNIALSGSIRHIIVFKSDALGLEFLHDTLYILADHPCQGCGLIGSSVLRFVNVNRGTSTPGRRLLPDLQRRFESDQASLHRISWLFPNS